MTPDILAWIQAATFLVIALTLIVYWLQLRALQGQIAAARDGSRTQNLLALVDYIQRPEHRKARRTLSSLRNKPLSEWTPEERIDAEMACSAWDFVGIMLRETDIPGATELVTKTWRHSIYSCFEISRQLTLDLREIREPDFWDDFEWLAKKSTEGYVAIDGKLRPKHD